MNEIFAAAFLDELRKLAGWEEDLTAITQRHKKGFGKAMMGLKERLVGKIETAVHKRLGTGEAKPLSNTYIRRKESA